MKPQGLIARFDEVARVGSQSHHALSKNTRATYLFWIRKFWGFVGRKPASLWQPAEVSAFMHRLHRENYAPKSRKQALCALVFVFKNVLRVELGTLDLPAMPREKKTLKIIPSREEVARIFAGLRGMIRIMAGLMYGAGLRVAECCELRVKDVDIEALTIRIHGGKGNKDRLCILPRRMVDILRKHLAWRAALHERDLAEGAGLVELPGRLAIKYQNAHRELGWQYLFPSSLLRRGRRWHAVPEGVQKALKRAVRAAGITKRVTPHTLRHAFCTHALRAGNDVATVQALMGHESLETTMIYAHGDRARGISPMDAGDLVPRAISASEALMLG